MKRGDYLIAIHLLKSEGVGDCREEGRRGKINQL